MDRYHRLVSQSVSPPPPPPRRITHLEKPHSHQSRRRRGRMSTSLLPGLPSVASHRPASRTTAAVAHAPSKTRLPQAPINPCDCRTRFSTGPLVVGFATAPLAGVNRSTYNSDYVGTRPESQHHGGPSTSLWSRIRKTCFAGPSTTPETAVTGRGCVLSRLSLISVHSNAQRWRGGETQ